MISYVYFFYIGIWGSDKSVNDGDKTVYWVIGGILAAGAAGVGIWALTKGGGDSDGFFCRP